MKPNNFNADYTAVQGLVATAGTAVIGSGLSGSVGTINFLIDGGGSTIGTGVKGDAVVDFACTLTAWTVLADTSGSIVVDVWRDAYGSYPPTDADAMPGVGNEPTISSAVAAQGATTGWDETAIAAGDTLRFNVDSCSSITRAALALTFTRG